MRAVILPFRPKPLPAEPIWDADKCWSGEHTAPIGNHARYPDPPAAAPADEPPAA